MSHQPPRCDACGRRIRQNHHELRLSDFTTNQLIGRYHARPGCRDAATKYFERGVVLRLGIVHPDRCGPEQENCDGGLLEEAAPTA
jgi:hypothetical protein